MSNPHEQIVDEPTLEAPPLIPRLELPPLAFNLAAAPRFGQTEAAERRPLFIETVHRHVPEAVVPDPPAAVVEPPPVAVEPQPVLPPPQTLGGIFGMNSAVTDAVAQPADWYAQAPEPLDSPFAGVTPSAFAQTPVAEPADVEPVVAEAPVPAVELLEFERPAAPTAPVSPPPVAPVRHTPAQRKHHSWRPTIIATGVLAVPAIFVGMRIHDIVGFAKMLGSAL
jgi:hypothetical protein